MDKKERCISRRDFLSKSTSRITAGIIAFSKKPHRTFKSHSNSPTLEKKIIHRTLGKTGINLPIVNMGVMNSFNPALVKRSYEIGVRHFDTAAYYQRGLNEKMIGTAIKELNVRDKVIIGTKVFIPHQQRDMPHAQAKEIFLKTADQSLRCLQTDYVDILYSHNVQTIEYLNNPGILEALQELKQQKKTRFIGFSTHTNMATCIREAIQRGSYDVILTTFNYALAEDKSLLESLQTASSSGIGIIAMKTQCSQYWYREYVPPELQRYYKDSIMHTAVLKWALRNDFTTCAIPGYTTFQQIEENFSVAYDLEFTPKERKFLQDRDFKNAMGYCYQCSRCLESCPSKVNIPSLMCAHMYFFCYSKL